MGEKPELDGPRTLGRYVRHGEIASGGMAVVHFGRLLGPVGFARTVAIKRLHSHLAKDPGFRAMFLDEARLAARIRHPNVVPTLDVLEEDEALYLVMEYVHGESLDRLLRGASKRGEVVPVAVAAAVARDVLHGLHAAHEATSERGKPLGIVHRDVSPQNILVGADGLARVLDFGVAKAQARMQLTAEGQLKGKIAYMAPEQVEQTPVDRRADVWSLAVVLWETLTGKRLFVGDHPAQLMKVVLAQPIPSPTELAPHVPDELARVVMRGLEREREARFASAEEMAQAISASGLPAAPHEVGAFVQQGAAEALAKRTRALLEIEAGATETGSLALPRAVVEGPGPSDAPAEARTLVATSLTNAETRRIEQPASRSASRGLAFGAVALVAAGLGAAAALLLRSEAPPATLATTVAAPAVPGPSPEAPAGPAPVPSAVAIAEPDAALPPPVKAKPWRPPAPSKATAPTERRDCVPPYIVKDGVRVPKLHCL